MLISLSYMFCLDLGVILRREERESMKLNGQEGRERKKHDQNM